MIEAGYTAARAVREAHFGPLYLPIASLAAQLTHDLNDLCCTGGANGMALGEQSTGWINRNSTAYRCFTVFEQLSSITTTAEP